MERRNFDVLDGSTLRPSGELLDHSHSISQVRPPSRLHTSPSHLPKLNDGKKTLALSDKKTKTKLTLDNNTGLRKSAVHHSNRLPANVLSERPAANGYLSFSKVLQDRNRPDSILASPHCHHTGFYEIPDQESNRSRKKSPKSIQVSQNFTKAAWISNRHPASLLHQFSIFRKEPDSKDRTCLTECHKERDEREAYCHSDFAVNGIVYDVDPVARGIQLLTVMVTSGGLYKINRLYITPDGDFFRVKILIVDNPQCYTRCMNLTLGSRYIIMGQIYHRRMELPTAIQQAISSRLRAGDGLVTSGRSFIRRFTRKKDRRVLAAAHSKCK